MPDDAIHELVIDERPDRVVVRIVGEVDRSNARELEEVLRTHVSRGLIVIDLTETTYFDSAGVAMLYGLRRDTDLALVVHTASITRRVLQITGLDQLVPILNSSDDPTTPAG
jgi:anti-anti-sigma factor